MKPPMALTTSVERRKVAEQRTKSEEPSLTFTPARYGSVGRDEGFRFPTRNWRSQLREQQLADNRYIFTKSTKSYFSTFFQQSLREFLFNFSF